MGVHLQPREGSVSVRRDGFSTYHPMICFVYFVIILICSMIFMAPACLSASFAGAFSYAIYITGKKAMKTFLCLCLPVMAAAVLVNFLFNHHGVTILFYIGDNPVTKEALCYGAASASVFASVIIWCCCAGSVLTGEKITYLFGRLAPVIALVITMVFRSIPRFSRKIKEVSEAQRAMGLSGKTGVAADGARWNDALKADSGSGRLRSGFKTFSIVLTWALENSIDTADSMKARGYGLRGRTSYHRYRFDVRDAAMLAIVIISLVTAVLGGVFKIGTMQYYPEIIFSKPGVFTVMFYIFYAAFAFLPVIINVKEDITWRSL